MPMLLQGEKTGVEFAVFNGPFYFEEFEDLEGEMDPSLDRPASFRWAGDEKAMLCGLCGAARLARLINGVVLEEMGGIVLSPDEAWRSRDSPGSLIGSCSQWAMCASSA